MTEHLATYDHCVERISTNWAAFLNRRRERLAEQERYGAAAEKVAENILEDLFTLVLDWGLSDLNHQVGYADLSLTRLGIKYLIIEAKRPGALAWHRQAVDAALDQARRYAAEQKVACIGVSDGVMLYAADVVSGGLRDRVFVSLTDSKPPDSLWWLSVHGIYRSPGDTTDAAIRLLPELPVEEGVPLSDHAAGLLHPKYQLPAHCFAYVPDASEPGTWKLPYLREDGRPDGRRLPKAIQAVISNYRGTKVSGIPDNDIPDVLARLGHAATGAGKMPFQAGHTAGIYHQLEAVLDQLGKLEEVKQAAGLGN
ncbi:MAG: hypothetical protein P8099_12805 [Gemmatimonadota bacterium]|jgi:hypothetical protein